jgi:hypothetical protein
MTKINGFNMYNPFQTISLTTPQSTTSSLTEVKLGSIFVPANTFKTFDVVKLESFVKKTGTNDVSNVRLYWNNTDDLTTPVQIAENIGVTATATAIPMVRRLSIMVSDGSGNGTNVLLNTFDIYQDYIQPNVAALTSTPSSLAIDWTIDSYIILAGDVDNASDNINCQWIRITNG